MGSEISEEEDRMRIFSCKGLEQTPSLPSSQQQLYFIWVNIIHDYVDYRMEDLLLHRV